MNYIAPVVLVVILVMIKLQSNDEKKYTYKWVILSIPY